MSSNSRSRRNLSLITGAFALVALGLGTAGYRYYLDQKTAIEGEERRQLAAIAELKVQQIVWWRRERMVDARILGATAMSQPVRAVLERHGDVRAHEQARLWLEEVRDAGSYANAVVLDRQGTIRLAVGRSTTSQRHFARLTEEVLARDSVVFSDFHHDEGLAGPHLGLNVPLRAGPQAQPEGVLLLGIDPNTFLNPLIQSWPTPSPTAEALLVRREGSEAIYLNELRHRKGTALQLRIPLSNRRLPAALGLSGFEGVTEGVDYRGVPVLAAIRKVPGTSWLLIAKVDLPELYGPIRQQAFWLALFAGAVATAMAAGVFLLVRDFRLRFYQQRYEAELERRALLGHYDYLSRFANDIILLTDQEGGIVEANERAVDAYGYGREELIGLLLTQLADPVARKEFERRWHSLDRQESLIFETHQRRKDGTRFPAEVSARRIEVEGKVFRQAIIRDTTERSKLQEQLQQAQKMESIGRLAGGVAHDFNNLLTIINGYTGLMLNELAEDHPMRVSVQEVGKAGQRAASLTQQLLAFSRRQVIAPKVINLNEIILDLNKMLSRLVGEDIAVITALDPGLSCILADPGQMQQLLMNLTTNARDAMPNGGALHIEAQNAEIDEESAAAHARMPAGRYVLLSVTDTGIGMEEHVRQHAFEPFFTTKPQGKGTGLGLATVYGIVKQSNGWIWVYSEPGKGTTFKIYLPEVSHRSESEETPQASECDLQGTETVLVVEDQDDVRRLAVDILARYGYRVLQASNPGEALGLCESFSESIDLLVTDVVMPGMTGRDLADRLKPSRPGMKVLFVSGYTHNVIAHRGVLDPGVAYLSKPFSPAALAQKVRDVLKDGSLGES